MRIAITGGIAEGKSTVLSYLEQEGYAVASSDRVARAVFHSAAVQEEIAQLLGLSAPVAAEALRERLADATIRRAVNRITHPRILLEMRGLTAQFFEVPLLIETCLQGQFDRVWVVTCGIEEQRRRLESRLGSAEAMESLLNTQLVSRVKIAFADRVIRTNSPETSVMRNVAEAAKSDLCG